VLPCATASISARQRALKAVTPIATCRPSFSGIDGLSAGKRSIVNGPFWFAQLPFGAARKKRRGRPSNPLKSLNEIVHFGVCPAVAVIPEIEQRILVTGHPVDHLRRHLADHASVQTVGDNRRNVSNGNRKARL